MEIEHHKWPSRNDWNSRMAKPWGISIISWRSRVVFNPLVTSDDRINHIVFYSRNFNQAIYWGWQCRCFASFLTLFWFFIWPSQFHEFFCWNPKSKVYFPWVNEIDPRKLQVMFRGSMYFKFNIDPRLIGFETSWCY